MMTGSEERSFVSGQYEVRYLCVPFEPTKPILALYWRSGSVHAYECPDVTDCLEMLINREMLCQVLPVAVVTARTGKTVCQFVDPTGPGFYRTAVDARAALIRGSGRL